MKPLNCPKYAWIRAVEQAAEYGHRLHGFWAWDRGERTFVLISSLNALPSTSSAKAIAINADDFAVCYREAFLAIEDVLYHRKERKRARKRK